MNDITPKKIGCCSLCDEPIREVVETWRSGPLDGEVRQFGAPDEGSLRVSVVLASGSYTDLSTCAKCRMTPETLPLAWKKMLAEMAIQHKDEWRKVRGLSDRTQAQRELHEKMNLRMANDIPLGVLRIRPWLEIR